MNRRITKANQELVAAIEESGEGDLNLKRYRNCEDAARKMEDILFSVGGAERVVKTLQYFKDRTAVEELTRARSAMAATDATKNYLSKDEKLSAIVMDSLKEFLGMFARKRGEADKGGGRRNVEDQNAYDAVMASLISEELDAAKLTKLLSQKFGITKRQLKRGRALRKNLKDKDCKHWIRKSSAVPRNAIGLGTVQLCICFCTSFSGAHPLLCIPDHRAAISELMHSNECSRVDNTDKVPAIVDLGTCPETGARIYDLHERRELLYSDNEMFDELTGRNRFDKSNPRPPHPTWAAVVESTKSDSRPDGIKDSSKLIRQCKCPCMKKMRPSMCSCPICVQTKDALRRFHKFRVGWHLQATNVRKLAIAESKKREGMSDNDIAIFLKENPQLLECNACNGGCCANTVYRKFSENLSTCMEALLCDQVPVPPLDLAALDDNFMEIEGKVDKFMCYREECCYGNHIQLARNAEGSTTTQHMCGWDAVFSSLPMHERIEKDVETLEETLHQVRACPDEYNFRGRVTWMDFIKVSHTYYPIDSIHNSMYFDFKLPPGDMCRLCSR